MICTGISVAYLLARFIDRLCHSENRASSNTRCSNQKTNIVEIETSFKGRKRNHNVANRVCRYRRHGCGVFDSVRSSELEDEVKDF